MRAIVFRAGAALFLTAAVVVPARLASASSGEVNPEDSGFQCPADQQTFDYIKFYIQQVLDAGIELPPELAGLSDEQICDLLTVDNGDDGSTSSTSEPDTTTSVPESTTSTSDPETTSTTSENSTSTTAQETTTTTAQETTTTTEAQTTTTTERATTTTTDPVTTTTAPTTTAAPTTTTAQATTTTAAATTTTAAHEDTEVTVKGLVVGAGSLPVTGGDPAPLVALASLVAGLGVFLLVLRRRFTS